MNATGDGDPERLVAYRVSASLFPLLGVEPMLGRSFVADEDRSGGDRVAIVSHGLWTRRIGARRDVLGEDIVLDGKPHRIVGVLPQWFRFPRRDVSLFVPLAMAAR
jgi:putative ABC transport system permease protein